MATIIRATKEHHETLVKLNSVIKKSLNTCNSEEIKQCSVEIDEAFKTLERLADENKMWETIDVEELN